MELQKQRRRPELGNSEIIPDDPDFKPKTIYGELKLSDKLSSQLEVIKMELNHTQERLKGKDQDYVNLEGKYNNLKKMNRMISMQKTLYKKQIDSFSNLVH